MESTPVKAVIFDLGNTLWFSGYDPPRAEMDRIAADLLAPWLTATDRSLPAPAEEILHDVWEAYDAAWKFEVGGGTLRDPSLPFLIREALAVRGLDIDQDLAEGFWRASWIGARRFGVELYPDAIDVLRALRERGLLIGICSNRPCTTAMMMTDLGDMGLAPYVDASVASGEVGFLKPHPATFERVLADLDVAPGEAAMVGDSAEADVYGARSIGMRTVWKLNGRYGLPACPDADHAIHELGELLTLPFFGAGRAGAAESLTPHEDGNEDRY